MILPDLVRCGIYRLQFRTHPQEQHLYSTVTSVRFQTVVLRDDQYCRTPSGVVLRKGWLSVPTDYRWDGAPCLPAFRSLIIPSLVHAALYDVVEEGVSLLTYANADEEFLYWCRMQGLGTIRSLLSYACVRYLGTFYRSFIK